MDNNYYYIISGLPDLILNEENKNFSYNSVRNPLFSLLSPKDQRLVEWLEFGLKEENMESVFYAKALKNKNIFIRNFFFLDLTIRELKVKHIAANDNSKMKYSVGVLLKERADNALENEITTAMNIQNLIEREFEIDKLKWGRYNSFITFDYFNINVILAFLAKAKILERWSSLNKQTGAELFRKFVDEVRGTFKGFDKTEIK